MPIRILRVKKRPPGAERLLREIKEKLRTLGPPTAAALVVRCIGCGKVGIFWCPPCRELSETATKRIKEATAKMMGTVEGKFAQKVLS